MNKTGATLMLTFLMVSQSNGQSTDAGVKLPKNLLLGDQTMSGAGPYVDAVRRYLNKQEPKIVGGKPALANSLPWQVSLGVSWIADPYRAHFCGGAAYNANWVVTAAHCLDGTQPRDVAITAGTNLLGVGGSKHNVNRIIVHSRYSASTYDNDIALVELVEPLKFGTVLKSIALLQPSEEAATLIADEPLVVSGWGATVQGGGSVRDLRYVDVPLVDRSACNRPLAYDGEVTVNMICAGKMSGNVDSCQGDSGGPLTVRTSTDPKLAGVVSWGEGCAKPNKVGVYTRVPNYVTWIQACVASPSTCP